MRLKKMAKKKDKKKAETPAGDWIDSWCKEHLEELQKLTWGWITVHPQHGIVSHDSVGLIHLIGRNNCTLKRSVLKDCVHVDVAKTVLDLKSKRKVFEPPPGRTPLTSEEVEDITNPRLVNLAQELGVKATEVLMFLLGRGATGVHINTRIDPETVLEIRRQFPKKKAKQEPKVWTKQSEPGDPQKHAVTPAGVPSLHDPFELPDDHEPTLPAEAKESPHKQPPFQPRPYDPFDRGALIDGGGAAWRNRTRFD